MSEPQENEEVVIEEVVIVEEVIVERGMTHVRFVVDNDNDGSTFVLKAKPKATIAKVIEKMYHHLNRAQQPGDRLTRNSDGSNVFDAASETAEHYAAGVPAKDRPWTFTGAPGGASR